MVLCREEFERLHQFTILGLWGMSELLGPPLAADLNHGF